jgi:hypothetical protein
MKIEGSGSISQRHGSADPDPSTPKCHGSATLVPVLYGTLPGTFLKKFVFFNYCMYKRYRYGTLYMVWIIIRLDEIAAEVSLINLPLAI